MRNWLIALVFLMAATAHAQAVTINNGTVTPTNGSVGIISFYPVSLGTINGHTAYGDPRNSNKLLSWINPAMGNSWYQFELSIATYEHSWPVVGSTNCMAAGGFGSNPCYYAYYGNASNAYQIQPADTCAQLILWGLAWKALSGSSLVLADGEAWATFILAHGVSAQAATLNIPFAASTPNTLPYDGWEPTSGGDEGTGRLEPDKAANFGYALVKDYESSGTSAFLTEALVIADFEYSSQQTSLSSTVSPWPFRIVASSGSVLGSETYNSDIAPQCRLFDEIIAQGYGTSTQRSHYASAEATAKAWLIGSNGPIATNNWYDYYEDQPASASDVVGAPAFDTAIYIAKNPSTDPSWQIDIPAIFAFICTTSSLCSNSATGTLGSALVGYEQTVYDYITASATGYLADAYANFAYAASNATDQDIAFRSFNWIPYMLLATTGANAGQCVVGPDPSLNTVVYFRVCYTGPGWQMLDTINLYPQWGTK